jgi:hypothetical protein
MIVIDCLQRDAVWHRTRHGIVTASRVADAIAKRKPKKGQPPEEVEELACRRDYRLQLVSEILTGISVDHYVSPAMEYGTENEPLARAAYEMAAGMDVEQVGFVLHPTIARGGCSPDGIIGTDGLVEFKVPASTTHIQYLIDGMVPDQYIPQMMFQMACCERQYCDFVSHDPRMKDESLQTFICRLPRDNAVIAAMEAEVLVFLGEVDGMLDQLKGGKRNE